MSRSIPTDNSPHPCTRWCEWDGSNGGLRYYDKTKPHPTKTDKDGQPTMGVNVEIPDGFVFLLLDELAVIKGWHDASESGITSNEVRDTRSEPFVVKAFKGGILASGLYGQIKDRVAALGGSFGANCYIGFKDATGKLVLGSILFKGAALGAWMEFRKANRAELLKKAVQIKGFTEGKKGKIIFRTPNFHLRDVAEETNKAALELDGELQKYLTAYFSRTKTEQANKPAEPAAHGDAYEEPEPPAEAKQRIVDDSDIPYHHRFRALTHRHAHHRHPSRFNL